MFTPLLDDLIESFKCLPGVGQKSAQRMAFNLIERNREGGKRLADAIAKAMQEIGHCENCRTFSEQRLCRLCASDKRDDRQLCVVESPADVVAIEQSGRFEGRYFVLLGVLSPIDGITPEHIGLPKLVKIVEERQVQEVIVATNPTVEGEATAHYIAELVQPYKVTVSRIAQGVPIGGELEYVDGGTIAHAFVGRRQMERV